MFPSDAHAEIRTKNLRNRNLLTPGEDVKILRRFYESYEKSIFTAVLKFKGDAGNDVPPLLGDLEGEL